jgi:SIT family siderophore-iron:H+ symporter-like MFS transporter
MSLTRTCILLVSSSHLYIAIWNDTAGVKRIEATSAQLGKKSRPLAFFGVLLIAYAISIDGVSLPYSTSNTMKCADAQSIRYTLQTYATSSYGQHSLLITMGVLQGVIGAAGQPVAAKISDVVGRVEMLIAALVFYCVGTIIEASSKSIGAYAGGVVIYQIGFTMYTIIIQVIVTDLSSLQGRLFASFIPPSPWIINTWISGNILAGFVSTDPTSNLWRWGLGMLTIITPGT